MDRRPVCFYTSRSCHSALQCQKLISNRLRAAAGQICYWMPQLLSAVRAVTASATISTFNREPKSVLTCVHISSRGCGAAGSNSRCYRWWRSQSPRHWRSSPYTLMFSEAHKRKLKKAWSLWNGFPLLLCAVRVWEQTQLCLDDKVKMFLLPTAKQASPGETIFMIMLII